MAKTGRYNLNRSKYLLDPEVGKLEALIEDFGAKQPRDTALLELALFTGARATELLNLCVGDLNLTDETLLIRGIKNSNDRELPLKSRLARKLAKLNEQKDEHAPIFSISYSRLRQIWEFYRPVHKKFHSLRHTFAIRLFKKTKDLRLVQVALGHRNITNTM